MGTPNILSIYLISTILSTPILAATNSDPYVAVSTPFCFLLNQSIGVLFNNISNPVTDLPVTLSWYKLASANIVIITSLPLALGIFLGISSSTLPYTYVQSNFSSGYSL